MNYPHDCSQNTKQGFVLVKYPPHKKHDPEYSSFRSVVFYNNLLVCMSPAKSVPYERFKTYPISSCVVEEFVEGTMINMWYCQEAWHIATRSILGAECCFETNRTFASMFYECLNNTPIELNPKYCYSMVMQHPENRIVSPVTERRLYVVATYEIKDNIAVEIHEQTAYSPPRYEVQSYEEAESLAQTVSGKGLMLKCNGERCKIKRLSYYEQESAKGNTSFRYRYLGVRNTPERETFLSTFPFYQEDALCAEQEIRDAVKTLYDTYVSVYIRKQFQSKEFSYKKFLYEVHMIYVHTIRPGRMSLVRVQQYVNELPPNQLTTLLRVMKTPRIELPTPDTPPLSLPEPGQE